MSDARRSKAESGASSGRGDFDGPRPDSLTDAANRQALRPWCECDPEYEGRCPAPCALETIGSSDAAWGREEWESATVEEMRDHLDAIGPPWGNPKLGAMAVVEAFWIAYEALDRLEKR